MTTLPKAPRFHFSPQARAKAAAQVPPASPTPPRPALGPTSLNEIQAEGLTGRQLRMARRLAQRHGITAESDLDAVRQLREAGIDPLQRKNVLEETPEADASQAEPQAQVQLPQVAQPSPVPAHKPQMSALEERASEIRKMQLDIARRRRRNLFLMAARLLFFVFLPTLIAGFYYYRIATPMYATYSEFVIQKASAQGRAGGVSGLFQGTSMAMQQDSTSVQAYLSSRAAMERLDSEHDFRSLFSAENIDPLQRLAPDANREQTYKIYKKRIRISYDPTEGLVRMEVSGPDPEAAMSISQTLITYAEEQVDQMTQRLREDQMKGALENYENAEAARAAALRALTRLKTEAEVIDPQAESSALMGRIGTFEGERDRLELERASLLDNPRPNAARVAGLEASIRRLNTQIENLRSAITQESDGNRSQNELNALVREAEENYQVRLALVQEALAQRESAQIEANRQQRYLSLSVPPSLPDAPAYPKGFENTALAFLIFTGIYLLLSLTAAVVREQITA